MTNKYTLKVAYDWCKENGAPDHVLAAISLAEYEACQHEWEVAYSDTFGTHQNCEKCGASSL